MIVVVAIAVTVVDSAVVAPVTLRSAVKVEVAQAMMLVNLAKIVQHEAISQYVTSVAQHQ